MEAGRDWTPIAERNGEAVYLVEMGPYTITESVAYGAFEGMPPDWLPYGKDVGFIVEQAEWIGSNEPGVLDHRRILKARIVEERGSGS